MIRVRPSAERGGADHGWLQTRHSFSFAGYQDPAHVQFRTLRVLNEDHVQPGRGFPRHGHRDMEILTWVLAGSLRHEDSMGHGSAIHPGEIQRMSAGSGVQHSEHNPSDREELHLLQIWILPGQPGGPPGYEQKALDPAALAGGLVLAASPDGRDGSVRVQQDASLWIARPAAGATLEHPLAAGRGAWLQVARGAVTLNGTALEAGDGAAIEAETDLAVTAREDAEVLLFDLA